MIKIFPFLLLASRLLTSTPVDSAGPNITKNLTASTLNGVRYIDGTKYPMTCAGIQSALADTISAGGGMVDAREVINATCSSEVDVGNPSSVPVLLVVPSVLGSWISTVSDGVHAGFKVFNLSGIVSSGGMCGAGLQFQLIGSSTFNGTNVFVTDPDASYVHLQGFAIALNSGGVVSSAIGEFQGFDDNSRVECVNTTNNGGVLANVPKVGYIHKICCTATFVNVEFEGQNSNVAGAGSIPLTIGNGKEASSDILFLGMNAVHPANGKNNIVITGSGTSNVFFRGNIYMEYCFPSSSCTDTTTPAIQVQNNAGPVYVDSVHLGVDVTGSTRFVFDNAAGSRSLKVLDVTSVVSAYCVNDHVTRQTVTGCQFATPRGLDTTRDTLANSVLVTPALTGLSNSTGLQLFNTNTTCTTTATINTPCTTADISLPVAYSDTNYRVSCTGLSPNAFPQIQTVTKSNSSFTITLNNLTAAEATYASFDCMVAHN